MDCRFTAIGSPQVLKCDLRHKLLIFSCRYLLLNYSLKLTDLERLLRIILGNKSQFEPTINYCH